MKSRLIHQTKSSKDENKTNIEYVGKCRSSLKTVPGNRPGIDRPDQKYINNSFSLSPDARFLSICSPEAKGGPESEALSRGAPRRAWFVRAEQKLQQTVSGKFKIYKLDNQAVSCHAAEAHAALRGRFRDRKPHMTAFYGPAHTIKGLERTLLYAVPDASCQ